MDKFDQLPMSETQLVRLCIAYLLYKGHYVWRNNTGAARLNYTNKFGQTSARMWRAGVKGSSDILGVTKDGKFLAVECKVGKNTLTALQQEFLFEIAKRGGVAVTAYSVGDLEGAGL